MTNGFTRRKEQSKEEIRKAAWELFSQFGVEKVSIVDIARKAGVSQATIYNNYGSKEALVREFVTTVIDQLVSQAQEVLSVDRPYWEKMNGLIRFLSGMMSQEVDSPVYNSSIDLLSDPEIKKIRDAAQEKMIGILLAFIQEGKEQGHIQADLSDDAFKVYFIVFMNVFADPQFRAQYLKKPQMVEHLGLLMIYGMGGQK